MPNDPRDILMSAMGGAPADPFTDPWFQVRYGVNAPQKVGFADTGVPLGVSPEEAQQDPDAADRAAATYLGTNKWGAFPSLFFHHLRQSLGGDSGAQDRMTGAAIQGAARSLEEQQTIQPNEDVELQRALLQYLGLR